MRHTDEDGDWIENSGPGRVWAGRHGDVQAEGGLGDVRARVDSASLLQLEGGTGCWTVAAAPRYLSAAALLDSLRAADARGDYPAAADAEPAPAPGPSEADVWVRHLRELQRGYEEAREGVIAAEEAYQEALREFSAWITRTSEAG